MGASAMGNEERPAKKLVKMLMRWKIYNVAYLHREIKEKLADEKRGGGAYR